MPVLANTDEDLFVGLRRAKAGQIQRREVVDPLAGRRQQAEINWPPHMGPARTTGRTAIDQEVILDMAREDEFQAQGGMVDS